MTLAAGESAPMPAGVDQLEPCRIVLRVASQAKDRTEADSKSDVRALPLTGALKLNNDAVQVKLEEQAGERRRVDVQAGSTGIKVKKDLQKAGVLAGAETTAPHHIVNLRFIARALTNGWSQRVPID